MVVEGDNMLTDDDDVLSYRAYNAETHVALCEFTAPLDLRMGTMGTLACVGTWCGFAGTISSWQKT